MAKTKDAPQPAPAGFNADERKAKRLSAPITIGGQTFYARPQNWDTTNEIQTILRRQAQAREENVRHREAIERLYDEAGDSAPDQAKLDELFARSDEARLASDEATFELIALLLRDEHGESPDVEFLKAELDVHDIGDLSTYLLSGGREGNGSQTTDTPGTSSS
jgi:hypothetical protein